MHPGAHYALARRQSISGKFDPYQHLRSTHNFTVGAVPNFDWLTHTVFQNGSTYAAVLDLKAKYQCLVIADEYGYEGNIRAVMAEGYATQGESRIVNGNNRDIFWAYGGEMVSESVPPAPIFPGDHGKTALLADGTGDHYDEHKRRALPATQSCF